jgi:UDP-GlcNAc:undecaprenyl-phosphate GlcNAc-1-phosphate transferase
MDFSIPTSILEKILKINDINISSEYDKYLNYWPLFVAGLILSFILIPLIGNLAKKFNITYVPGKGRNGKDFDNPEKAIHDVETPALGGLAVTIPILLGIIILFRLDATTIPILLALGVLVVGSVLDDVFNLSSKVQIGYQLLAAAIIAFSIIDLSFVSFFTDDFLNLSSYSWSFNIFSFPLSFVFPGDLILIAWILLCINSVKWVGGSPGLVESYSLIIFLLLFLIGVRTFSLFSSSMSILIAGSMISLLYFAYPSPKIMSGSSGKTIYGFLIAILALVSGVKFSTTLMLLALPILDAIYVIIYRTFKYKPKNPLDLMKINDTSHLHHRLLKLDLTSKQILLIETALSLLIGSLAILTTGALRYFALIFGIAFVISFIVFINYRANKKEDSKEKSPESKYSY